MQTFYKILQIVNNLTSYVAKIANCSHYFCSVGLLSQHSKFALAVGKCQGFCRGISPFYSICVGNNNAEAVKFLEIKKKLVFLELKKKFFVKEKKISSIKKPFLQDTNYSCASIFIIHTFIWYIHTLL